MNRLLLLTVLTVAGVFALIGATSGVGEQQRTDPITQSRGWPNASAPAARDSALDAQITAIMEEYHIPGLAISSFCTERVYHLGTYGYAQLEDSIPVTDLTTFCVASVSKIVSATSLLQAWEEHGFSLDADVADFLDFPVEHPDCPDSAVTFRKTLTHTASIMNNYNAIGAPPGMPICEGLAEYFDPEGQYYDPDSWEPLCPGRNYVYSNVGPTLLACLAGEIGGMPFPEYSQAYLFDPLGMDNTAWFGDQVDPANVAYSYGWNADGHYLFAPAGGIDWFVYPAACLRTSIVDLTRFAHAYMRGGELDGVRILEEATVDSAWTVQHSDFEDILGLMWHYWYGLASQKWYWCHLGSTNAYDAAVLIHEDRDFGVVYMSNGGEPNHWTGLAFIVAAVADHILDNMADCMDATAVPEPPELILRPNYPNPFNPKTTFIFTIDRPEHLSLEVFDLTGRQICILAEGFHEAGEYSLYWDGNSADGQAAPSGTYLVRLKTESGVEARKVMLIR